MKRNKKGFTLIELLAVIVILAILILLATPAVVGLMNKAKFNTFKLELRSIEEIAKTAYTVNKDEASETFPSYYMNCYTLEWLKENGYTDKNFENPGMVLIGIEGSEIYTTVIYSDGNYFFTSDISYLEDINNYQDYLDYKADVDSEGGYNSFKDQVSDTKDMCDVYKELIP
jgi:type IV pilus assembly protein PilA